MKPLLFALLVFLSGCAAKKPIVNQASDLSLYRYVLIEDTSNITAFADGKYREVNPAVLIEGLFLKRGIIKVNKPAPEILNQLLITKWGISGKREIMLGMGGYAQEVTITLLSARTLQSVFTCSAEGIGDTEADDIREAITECLAGLK
jgi:hypothetical protein